MLIFLIRHGQSEGNVQGDKKGTIYGRNDQSHLTEKGKKQIQAIGREIKKIYKKTKFSLWYSPVKRTKESALLLAKIINPKELLPAEELYDLNFGSFEGLSWPEISKKHPSWIKNFLQNRWQTAFINGESINDLRKRLEKFVISKLSISQNHYHLLITHEEVIRAFLSLFHPDNYFYHSRKKFSVANGSLSLVYLEKRKKLSAIVIQVGKNKPPGKINLNFLKKAFFLFKKEVGYPDEFLPRKNYSDNYVFTAGINQYKNTIKLVPLSFKDDLKKDINLSQKISSYLPTPKLIAKKIKRNFYFVRRRYLPGETVEYWLTSKKYKDQALFLMAKALKKIHQIDLSELDIKKYTKKSWQSDFIKPWMEADINVLTKIKTPLIKKIQQIFSFYYSFLKIKKITFLHNDFSTFNIALIKKNQKLSLSGIWDFERALSGDFLWDLAVTQKISFLKKNNDFKIFLFYYFNSKNLSSDLIQQINFYTLLNTTGAIHYRFERKRNIKEELKNLEYILKKYFLTPIPSSPAVWW